MPLLAAGAQVSPIAATGGLIGTLTADGHLTQVTADELARQTLAPGDGWASIDGGTTGGSNADEIIEVRTRDELFAAVQGDEPKIVRVIDDIDANTAADGTPLTCEGYAQNGYTLDGYLEAFDPAHWAGPASGPLEDARKASQAAQRAQISLQIGGNTTLIGADGVGLTGFVVNIADVDNVIVRNLGVSDAYDCFPAWNGETWKTEWDNLVVTGSTHVWLDHLTLDDGATVDSEQPEYFGERFLRHDGLLDVVRAADLVTISWSKLEGHDKSMLFGNGDTRFTDRGTLRVTLHHNEFTDLVQRAPRVRFGQVHVYNNVYSVGNPDSYIYSWGVGVESSVVARNNTFHLDGGLGADRIIGHFGGTSIDAAGTVVNGVEVDVLAAYNEANPDATLNGEVWGETGPHGVIQTAEQSEKDVRSGAGAGSLTGWQNPTDPAVAAAAVLDQIGASETVTADGPVWSSVATGFAATATAELPQGTTGGTGGETVTVRTAEELAHYAALQDPLTILVAGSIEVEPFGSMIRVSSNTTIIGIDDAELVGGGLFLDRVSNVIIRNLTFRDSYVPGDWDGKSADNDNDGIRIDTSSHVWDDHNEFTRLGDGLVDVRKDSTAITLSWNFLHDHNKTVGVGWTSNVITTITLHHNWFSNTYQRNGSIDNVAAGHLYNNWLEGQAHYGTMSRGASQLVVESSVYEHGEDAIVAKDEASRVYSVDNIFNDIRGRKDNTGPTFDPLQHYAYRADPVEDVVEIVADGAGTLAPPDEDPVKVTVALDGTGDYASIGAAVGAAWRSDRIKEIIVEPGTYREIVRVWPGTDGLTIRSSTGDPEDVVLTYDLAAGQAKFYGGVFGATGAATLAIFADEVTIEGITIENGYDEAAHGSSQAQALRTVGDRVVLDEVRLLGNQDTFLAESPKGEVSRVYVTDSYIEGDVDFIYGRATLVVTESVIHSLDRGQSVNGYVAAPSTQNGTLGFLLADCRFTSDAADGTVFLGRPWHPSSDPNVDPSVVVRDSWLDAHIRTPAWSDMSGWPWQEDFLREHHNRGPSAVDGEVEGRPQLTAQEARTHTVQTYLSGDDKWEPWRNR